MYEQTQFDILRPWIIRATELPEVILAHSGAPRPDDNYGLLNLIRSTRIGRPESYAYEPNTDGIPGTDVPFFEVAVQEFEFTWSFHVYAKDPINVANRLVVWAMTGAGRESLGELNMFNIADIQRIPELVENNWNDRATTELRVRSYVCTGTSNHQGNEVLLGRVPVDVAETVSVLFPGTTPALSLTTVKP